MSRRTRAPLIVTPCLLATACLLGGGGTPSPLRGYRVLIEAHDSLSNHLARALSRRGFSVRRHVQGGSPRTAALITFTFRDLGDSGKTWFNARLADTRSGAVVAAVSLPVDVLGVSAVAQARVLADSFAARRRPIPDAPP